MDLSSLLAWEIAVTLSSIAGAGVVFIKNYLAIKKLQLENRELSERLADPKRIRAPTPEEVQRFGTTEYGSSRKLPILGTILLVIGGASGIEAYDKVRQAAAEAAAKEENSRITLIYKKELLEARSEVLNVRGLFEGALEEYAHQLGLEERANEAALRLLSIPDYSLGLVWQVSKYESVAVAKLVASDSTGERAKKVVYSLEANQAANNMLDRIKEIRIIEIRPGGEVDREAVRWIRSEQVEARARYLKAIALAANARAGGAADPNYAIEELRKISESWPDYFLKFPPSWNPNLSWLLENESTREQVLEVLDVN